MSTYNACKTMTKKAILSAKNRKMLERFKDEARARILKRDFVEFRVDAPMMDLLLRVADYRHQPVGIMVREWVAHKLAQEAKLLPPVKVKLPHTKHGKPMAKLSPFAEKPSSLFGCMKGTVVIHGDIVESTDEVWEADVD